VVTGAIIPFVNDPVNEPVNPPTVAAPAANYSLAMITPAGSRMLHTSGIVGARPDGSVPADIGEQAEVIWATLQAILAEAGMGVGDVVSITTYVVADHLHRLGDVMAARDRALGGIRVASTLVTAPALARPEWSMEIALVAAH
jgi:2-iminobutanoate/2-iminopropanoate deaminase